MGLIYLIALFDSFKSMALEFCQRACEIDVVSWIVTQNSFGSEYSDFSNIFYADVGHWFSINVNYRVCPYT